ncbi:hypothetical protein KRMM14A1259_01700 [Krasilnikovia sp. MM14-A1259]
MSWFVALAYSLLIALRLPRPPGAAPDRWHVALLVLGGATAIALLGAAIVGRQPAFGLVLLLAGGACGASAGDLGSIPLPQYFAFYVALAFIAATRHRRTAVAGGLTAAGLFVAYQGIRLAFGWGVAIVEMLLVMLAAAVAWLIGRSVHERREHAVALRARIATDAINAERLRIARELHDMVAHNIGIVALQAGSANLVVDTQPEVARQALHNIEVAGRETLAGLRRMLVALRETPPEHPSTVPGLADVKRLATETSEAGLPVELRWQGDRRALPPEVDIAAYRIIQEAITNVVRHAGARTCRVTVEYQDEELVIEVLDDGTGVADTTGAGFGLIGMSERVGLLHGDFCAQPRPNGGFRVSARLPMCTGA